MPDPAPVMAATLPEKNFMGPKLLTRGRTRRRSAFTRVHGRLKPSGDRGQARAAHPFGEARAPRRRRRAGRSGPDRLAPLNTPPGKPGGSQQVVLGVEAAQHAAEAP